MKESAGRGGGRNKRPAAGHADGATGRGRLNPVPRISRRTQQNARRLESASL